MFRWRQLWLPHRLQHRPDLALWSPECGRAGLVGPGHREPDPGQPAAVWEQQKQGKKLLHLLAPTPTRTVRGRIYHPKFCPWFSIKYFCCTNSHAFTGVVFFCKQKCNLMLWNPVIIHLWEWVHSYFHNVYLSQGLSFKPIKFKI